RSPGRARSVWRSVPLRQKPPGWIAPCGGRPSRFPHDGSRDHPRPPTRPARPQLATLDRSVETGTRRKELPTRETTARDRDGLEKTSRHCTRPANVAAFSAVFRRRKGRYDAADTVEATRALSGADA